MANQLFDPGRDGFLRGSYSWLAGTWVPYIFGSFNAGLLATGLKVSDFGSGVFISRGTYLTSLTATTGVADAADTTIGAVGSAGAATAVAIVLVLEASQAAPASNCDWVVGYIDTASVLPFLPNGGDINVTWANTTNKIFKL